MHTRVKPIATLTYFLLQTTILFSPTSCINTHKSNDKPDVTVNNDGPPNSFEIPARPFNDIQLIGESDSYNTDTFSRGQLTVRRGREHMAPDWNHQQFWVEEGEPIIFDFAYKLWGFNNVEDFDIVVLANFRPIEFKTKRVLSDDDFPSVSQWLADSTESAQQAKVTIPDMKTVGVSIYIPPESVPVVGAYDLRVLLLSRFASDPEKLLVRNAGMTIQQSLTLYYGGVDFDRSAVADLENAQIVSSTRNAKVVATFGSYTTLLRPQTSVYDIDDFDHPLSDVHLGQIFTLPETMVSLIGESIQSPLLEEEKSVIMAFDAAVPLVGNSGLIVPPKAPEDDVNSSEKFVVQFPVNLELHDREIHPIRFVKMAQPFQDMLGAYDRKNEVSNTIFVQAGAH